MPVQGSCLCGAVKVTIDRMPEGSVLCHCMNCQVAHGTAFSTNVIVPSEQVKVEGETRAYSDLGTLTGQGNPRHFCPKCGTILFSHPAPFKGNHVFKAGIFKGLAPTPVKEIMTRDRVSYLQPVVGAAQAETM